MAVDYENPWMYEGKPFTSDDIGDYYGFVYRITNINNRKSYIGRKLQASQTGSDITEALMSLNETLKILAETVSGEKSSPSTQPLEK